MAENIDLSQVKWDQPNRSNAGIDLSQVKWDMTGNPAIDMQGANRDQFQAQDNARHPISTAINDTSRQFMGSLGLFGKNALLSTGALAQGMANKAGFGNPNGIMANSPTNLQPMNAIRNFQPEIPNQPAGKVAQQITGQAGNFAPFLAMGNPLAKAFSSAPIIGARGALGMGGATAYGLTGSAINQLQASGNNQPEGPAAMAGFGQGAGFGLAGAGGSALGRMAVPMLGKFAPNIGSGLVSAGFGAITAPQGEKVSSAIGAGALGAFNPINPNHVTQEQYNQTLDKASEGYRKVLNPGKNILNSSIDVDNAMKTLAKNGVRINTDANNKLDNSFAIQQLQQANRPHFEELNKIVSSDPHKQFDLEQLREEAKDQMEPYTKNAEELKSKQAQVDSAIDAEIARHGQFVNPSKLMNIKQGMYERAFTPLQPTANDGARAIGSVVKTALEEAFPTSGVAEINSKIGDNLEAMRLLEKTNGGVIQRGKLGKYAAQLTGAMSLDRIPIVGPVIGGTLGGGISDFMNSPERITSGLGNRMKNLQVTNPDTPVTRRPGVATPELMLPRNIVNGLNLNPLSNALPNGVMPANRLGYNPIPEYIRARHGGDVITPPVTGTSGFPINQPPVPGALGIPRPEQVGQIPRGMEARAIGESYGPQGQFIDENAMGLGQPLRPSPSPRTNLGGESDPNGFLRDSKNNMGKSLGLVGAIGAGSMFNPLNAQAGQVKEPERLQLSADQYTKKEEGFQAHPYIDTKGNKTIGYGFKMDAVGKHLPELVQEGKRPLTKDEADKLYTKLYANARNSAQSFAGDAWHTLNGQQQKALSDMSYNMGGKLSGFKKLRQALEDGDFHTASNEILNSKYAKEAPNRAKRNSILIQG